MSVVGAVGMIMDGAGGVVEIGDVVGDTWLPELQNPSFVVLLSVNVTYPHYHKTISQLSSLNRMRMLT